MKKELRIFFTALMFYTRIPCPGWVDHSEDYLNKATRYFPLIGWLIGLAMALVIYGSLFILPISVSVTSAQFEIQLAFGIAAVVGHLFPIFTGFRGGKGIATLLGILIGLNFTAALFSLLIFVFVFVISKYVSLASILASMTFPVVVFQILKESEVNSSLEMFAIFVPILTLITHQKNIERLIRGEENKAKFGKK